MYSKWKGRHNSMAIINGTNSGFLYAGTSPSDDPAETGTGMNYLARAIKDTAPTGATVVTEIGWYNGNATAEANFEVGIYTHNAGDDNPEEKVGDFSTTNAKGTTAGWKKVTGLNIPITAGTIYWIAIQLDDTVASTEIDSLLEGSYRQDYRGFQTQLVDPWGSGTGAEQRLALYAVTDATPSAGGGIEGQSMPPYVY